MKKRRLSDQTRLAVAEKYGARRGIDCQVPCHYCGRVGRIRWVPVSLNRSSVRYPRFEHEIDHLVAEYLGGSDDLSNLVLACQPCNRSKGTKTGPAQWAINGEAMNSSWRSTERARRSQRFAVEPPGAGI